MTVRELFATLLGADPSPWIIGSGEPFAKWALLTGALGLPEDGPEARAVRGEVPADERVVALVAELPEWGEGDFPGHHSPAFLPNRLNLLADMGVRGGDFDRIEALLDGMLERQSPKGRFQSFGRHPGRPEPEWGSLLCDTNVITDVLLRFGRGEDPRVHTALKRMERDLSMTPQGAAWGCVPERATLFRGPGRRADVCPQVTLEGLRAFSHVPPADRPSAILAAARTPLEVWRRRAEEKPYMFGHGYQFKSVKWPNIWYDVLWVLETVGRYPHLWRGPGDRPEDRRAIAEMAACLIAYNFDADGRLTPRRAYTGFENLTLGQKKEPSPFATALALSALARLSDLADQIASTLVEELPSSKGGAGTARPPSRRRSAPCPMPPELPAFPAERAVWRVLARHHLGDDWEPASVETVVADVVGVHAALPVTPYAALGTRLPGFGREQLDRALYERRSLARFRCMRGAVFVVRAGLLPVLYAATSAQVVRYARRFAEYRGVTSAAYVRLVPQVLEALAGHPATASELRARLPVREDLGAVLSLMAAEGLLLRDRPTSGWAGRRHRFAVLTEALPGIDLRAMSEQDADAELVRAYIRAFGPVTARDVAWWTGFGANRAARALARLEDEVLGVRLTGAGSGHLMHSADADELGWAGPTTSPSVHLLPAMDPCIMGYADKSRFLRDRDRPFVFDRSGNVTSTVLVDGGVAGVWDAVSQPVPEIRVRMFEDTPPLQMAAIEQQAAAAALLRFDAEAPVRFVPSMRPLVSRGAGSVGKPLR